MRLTGRMVEHVTVEVEAYQLRNHVVKYLRTKHGLEKGDTLVTVENMAEIRKDSRFTEWRKYPEPDRRVEDSELLGRIVRPDTLQGEYHWQRTPYFHWREGKDAREPASPELMKALEVIEYLEKEIV